MASRTVAVTAVTGVPAFRAASTSSSCRPSSLKSSSSPPYDSASRTACGPSTTNRRSATRAERRGRRRTAATRGERVDVMSGSGGLGRAAGLGHRGPGDLDERGERRRVRHGQVGEDLAVDLDAGRLEPLDEPVVGHAVLTRGGVDPGDPQLPEVALALLAVAELVCRGVWQLRLRLALEPAALTAVAAGLLEDLTTLLVGVDRPLDACHNCTFSCRLGLVWGLAEAQRPSSFLMVLRSAGANSVVPVRRRVSLLGLRSSRWRLPAFSRSSLPLPVTFTRFFVPLCVFCLGMSPSSSLWGRSLSVTVRSGAGAGRIARAGRDGDLVGDGTGRIGGCRGALL